MLGQRAPQITVCWKGLCNVKEDFVWEIPCSLLSCVPNWTIRNIEGNAVLIKERCFCFIHSLEPHFDTCTGDATQADCLVSSWWDIWKVCPSLFVSFFLSFQACYFSHIVLPIVVCAFMNAPRLPSSLLSIGDRNVWEYACFKLAQHSMALMFWGLLETSRKSEVHLFYFLWDVFYFLLHIVGFFW